MAGKRLVGFTALRDDDGIVHSFGPGDDLPAWAAKRITNPKLFGESADGADDSGVPASGTDDGGQGGGDNLPEPPPKGGKGSGLEEWLAYAAYFPGVTLSDDPSREDVIDALDAAGVRTE